MVRMKIFHVDDEPERINWIPSALRSTYYNLTSGGGGL